MVVTRDGGDGRVYGPITIGRLISSGPDPTIRSAGPAVPAGSRAVRTSGADQRTGPAGGNLRVLGAAGVQIDGVPTGIVSVMSGPGFPSVVKEFGPMLIGVTALLTIVRPEDAILGMRKAEIEAKFDEIVAFAEVEQFIDTPVKRYSSGMYLRLAFAVAAHLEPEILLVDEVLAVGDATFQKKCMGKLGSVAQEGRTVLFVSHNMGAIRSMCTKGVVLEKGRVRESGDIGAAMAAYYKLIGSLESEGPSADDSPRGAGFGRVVVDCDGSETIAQAKSFEAATTLTLGEAASGFTLHCHLVDMLGREVFIIRESSADLGLTRVGPGTYSIRARFPPLWLSPGLYALWFKVLVAGAYESSRHVSDKATIDVEGTSGVADTALLHPGVTWAISRQ